MFSLISAVRRAVEMQDMKTQAMTMKNQTGEREFAGRQNARHENSTT